jgi:hypothetical protein
MAQASMILTHGLVPGSSAIIGWMVARLSSPIGLPVIDPRLAEQHMSATAWLGVLRGTGRAARVGDLKLGFLRASGVSAL